jgi:hypothetical protein
LEVKGAFITTTNTIATGSAVDLSLSNVHVLVSPGTDQITLNNFANGGAYTLVFKDGNSRLYNFVGCASQRFKPENIATTPGSHSIFSILSIDNGSGYDCYINWSSGY